MKNARLDEAQVGIKIAGRNSNNLRYADDTTLKRRGTKESLENEKGEVTICNAEIQRIVRDYYEQLLSHFSRVRLCVTP